MFDAISELRAAAISFASASISASSMSWSFIDGVFWLYIRTCLTSIDYVRGDFELILAEFFSCVSVEPISCWSRILCEMYS